MENASKALIIAGAILLSIVIISLGLVVVNNVRDTINNTNMDAQEIEAFNGKLTPYGGGKVSGTRVKALIDVVSSNNAAEHASGKEIGDCNFIDVDAGGATVATGNNVITGNSTGAASYPTFSSSKYFKVEFQYTKGVITKVIITNV